MDSDFLVTGLLWFIVFLFSTTCHEAAHAWTARRGGDDTAYHGGQVSLDPLPHIRREPFGMVIIPWLTFYTMGWMMGWASAPYNPHWARAYPRRAAWMALAGPAANFALVLISLVLIRVGLAMDVFKLSGAGGIEEIVRATSTGGAMQPFAAILSVMFSLNLLLGTFNLIPVPPLDGFSVLGLFLPESGSHALMNFRDRIGPMAMIGLLVVWRYADTILDPVFNVALRLL